MADFSQQLIEWYKENKRELPWRDTQNAYLIWLSEVILQQTRVEQGLPYYEKFVQAFPKVENLAGTPQDSVMKLWQGLGYYSRARNLHTAAKTITKKYNGHFPENYNDIRALKGVGEYTAAAVASFAFDLPYAVVDGNVYRVLSRYFGIDVPIDTTRGKKLFRELAQQVLDDSRPGLHNQAVMEFGALHCKPSQPLCGNCPLSESCVALADGKVTELPVKSKKVKVKKRYFNYLVFNYDGHTYIKRRREQDIWKGLYDFPLLETEKQVSQKKVLQSKKLQLLVSGNGFTLRKVSSSFKHILTHRKIHARFFEIDVERPIKNDGLIEVKREEIHTFALPRLLDKYLGGLA